MSAVLLYIPKRKHTSIIGKGGATVKQLQETHKVKINVPGKDDPSTEITITGKVEDIEKVREHFEKVLGIRAGTEPAVELELDVNQADFKLLIGRGGETLRDLEAKHGVSINVPRQNDANQHVIIEGSSEGVHDAHGAISRLLRNEVKVIKGLIPNAVPSPVSVHSAAKEKEGTQQHQGEINKVLFFPDVDHNHNLEEFLATLHSAKTTLDICVFTITDDRIASTILNRLAAKVKVRVITDNDQSVMLGSDVQKMKDAGVPLKMDVSPYHMHHKFAVVDQQLLVNGSFNWTRGASRDNCENVMITNNKQFVTAFHDHFEKMWNDHVNFK